MRLHYLQHVPFEDAGEIATWARDRGHHLTGTRLYADEPLPTQDQFDWLVVMGGPMNIYEYDRHPWLVREKECILKSISNGKTLLGVCLGAQLIADVLGGPVVRNQHLEIGWHPVTLMPDASKSPLFADWPTRFDAFHWHGDTFQLPPGAARIAASEACGNQAFLYAGRVVALQFHLEYTAESIRAMLDNCSHELLPGPYVQDLRSIESGLPLLGPMKTLLCRLLDALAQDARGSQKTA